MTVRAAPADADCWGIRSSELASKNPGSSGSRCVMTARRIGFGRGQRVLDGEVLGERHSLAVELHADTVRGLLLDLRGVCFAGDGKTGQGMLGAELETDGQLARALRAVHVGPERNGEVAFQLLDAEPLVIFNLDPLVAPGRDRRHAGHELGAPAGLIGTLLAHLQQTGIQRLNADIGVDFLGPLALQNHSGDARDVVPDGEVRHDAAAGQRE